MSQEIAIKNLIFVDCEGHGRAPTLNDPVAERNKAKEN
jgi:hypothetical protein